jgi:phenylacetate-coenzyme A ligase PaaK-like adenylate-forming protein
MPFDTINGNDLLEYSVQDFEATALKLYHYQYERNELYKAYNDALRIDSEKIKHIEQIPFLPISFFKSHLVNSFSGRRASIVFDSSGTSGMMPSQHHVLDTDLYKTVAKHGFEQLYGPVGEWVILALLPSYLERSTSSLVYMAKMLMDCSNRPENGFYLNEFDELKQQLLTLKRQNRKVLLLGVTFALLDFAAQFPEDLSGVVVMETGGMKGRQAEWTRTQVHQYLSEKWNLTQIHSEYGMTELLSQAYAISEGIFRPIKTMKALIRDVQDPLDTHKSGQGALNIIDLANVHSCSFIATEDMGKVYDDGTFEVLGRMDFAALRGCSLMAI